MARSRVPSNEAAIVAELGRPETPEETAARKAASSKRYRDSKTPINLVIALFASLAIVLVTVMIVVRPDPPATEPIDYSALATQVQRDFDVPIADPELGEGWWANAARIESGPDGVSEWYIGLITPENGFAALTQGIDANPTWLAATLDGGFATGTTSVGGHTWDVYDRRDAEEIGNLAYAMTTVIGTSTIVLHGTADDAAFEELAAAVAASLAEASSSSEETP